MHRNGPPLDDQTFAATLAAVRSGDQRATEHLFADLHPRLLRFLRTVEPRAADDLAGDVWLSVARGLPGFAGDLAGFRSWVFTIARRRLADHRRSAVRRSTEPVDAAALADLPASDDVAGQVSDSMSAQDALDTIARLLPADQLEVLTLRLVGDLDVAQVAQVMGRSANWVRVTQHRALRRLATAGLDAFREDPARTVIPSDSGTI